MLDYTLSPEQVDELRAAHCGTQDKREADRIKAVVALATGWTAEEVAEILQVDANTVRNHFKRYRVDGLAGLDMEQSELKVQHMKVAVFSDVQGNLPAMEVAVEHILDWNPDLVVMAGDLVNRGPSSRACLELFDALRRERGWLPITGNHEAWVLRCGRERPLDALDAAMRRFADVTFREIAEVEEALLDWPDHISFHADTEDSWVHVTHGSMAGHRVGISATTTDQDLHGRLPENVSLFVGAHTHKPLQRRLGRTRILNVGSVGSPFDDDVRACYGRLALRGGQWQTHIVRLPYDRARTERDFMEAGFIEQGGPLARIIFEEWCQARVLLARWHHRYGEAVRNGAITLEDAVTAFLRSL